MFPCLPLDLGRFLLTLPLHGDLERMARAGTRVGWPGRLDDGIVAPIHSAQYRGARSVLLFFWQNALQYIDRFDIFAYKDYLFSRR